MIKAAQGQAEGIDTLKIVESVIIQCRQQLEGRLPQAGIVFAGADFDHQQILDEINRSFPGIELIGCTTVGELSSSYGFSDDSVSLMVFYSNDIEIRAGVGRRLSEDPQAAVNAALRQVKDKLTQQESVCLALPDGRSGSFNIILKSLNSELNPNCPVFGGCAGRQEENQQILQFFNNEVLSDSLPIMIFAGPMEYAFSIANSWKPIGRQSKITEAEGCEVKRIGNRSALDFYRYYLGKNTDPAVEFPLAVYEKTDQQFYLRGPINFNESNGSVFFTETVPQGAIVQLTEAIREVIIEDTKTSTDIFKQKAHGFQPEFALAFSCVLRKEALGTRIQEEIQILENALPPNFPINGFYGYGEIAPLVRGQGSHYHNATLVTLLLGKSEARYDRQNDFDSARPSKVYQSDQIEAQKDDIHIIEQLRREKKFLQKKLVRSENYRERLEKIKELNAALHHKIIQEVDAARREIQEKEAALRKSEEKYRRIVETAGEGFVLMDENLVIKDVNDAYSRMTGYAREELLGKTPLDLATEEYRQFLITNRQELLSRDYREIEGTIIAKDGRHIPILIHSNSLKNDQGNLIGQMAFVTDMTQHKKALALAAEVQKSLLPQSKPLIKGLDVAGKNVSCDEIGGDYFDFIWRRENPDGPFSVVVGDITGHGVDAALLMTSARAFLRMRASQPGTISQVVTEMNRHLSRDVLETGRFMTLFYMMIDPKNDQIQWVRAGHDPAIVYDPDRDRIEELKGNGLALGVDENFVYEEYQKIGLNTGQIIAIGTDGIWEAYNKDGEMFGKARYRNIIRKNAAASANEILKAVYSEVNQFTEGLRSEDDITLVVVKVLMHRSTESFEI